MAEWITYVEPEPAGLHRYGEANVLSTAAGTPASPQSAAQRREVGHGHVRVRDRLHVEERRAGQRGAHRLQVVRVDEIDLHPEARQHPRGDRVGPRRRARSRPPAARLPAACAMITVWIAAIPEANPNAASVPSNAAICASNACTVGLP